MHYSTDVGDIKRELSELGHEVMHVRNILHSRTKNPLSLFSLELKTNTNNRDIFSITDLLKKRKISFEKPYKTRSLPQCTNCQKYGHTKNFSTKKPVSVKCAGNHSSFTCSSRLDRDKIKCALYNENHTGNYKSCVVYKTIFNQKKIKEIKPQAEKTTSPLAVENFIKPTLSYSQADSNNAPISLIAESNAVSSNDFNDLKDNLWLKLAICSIS